MGKPKGDEETDYAVAAAREWFADEQAMLTRGKESYPHLNEVWKGKQLQLDRNVKLLAGIIRNQVEEYKYRHSWSCDDSECCPR